MSPPPRLSRSHLLATVMAFAVAGLFSGTTVTADPEADDFGYGGDHSASGAELTSQLRSMLRNLEASQLQVGHAKFLKFISLIVRTRTYTKRKS